LRLISLPRLAAERPLEAAERPSWLPRARAPRIVSSTLPMS
jgi:hypothetical protein